MNTCSIPVINKNKILNLVHLCHACKYYLNYIPIGIDETLQLDSYDPINTVDVITTLPVSPALQEHFMASQTLIATITDCNTQLINLLFPFAHHILSVEFSNYQNSHHEFYSYISLAIVNSVRKYDYSQTDIISFLYEAIRKEFQDYINELKISVDQNNY